MRPEEVSHLKLETNTVTSSLEKLEREIKEFEKDLAESKKIRRLARLIVSGKLSKEISAEIEKLKNLKIELIFTAVKKEMRNWK